MAAAAIITGVSVAAQAAPLIVPAIKDLVMFFQNRFGHNNGTGQAKRDAVVEATQVVADKLSTAGQIQGVLDKNTILGLVEGVVQVLKASGALPSDSITTPLLPATPTSTQPQTSAPATIQGLASGVPVTIVGTITIGKL